MPGVVSLLQDESEALVRGLWREVEERTGIVAQPAGAVPHITYHVAGAYRRAELERRLHAICARLIPFQVECSGIGIFTGSPLVLYLSVVRTRALSDLQQQVWEAVQSISTNPGSHWRESRWVPHVTIAMEGLTAVQAASIVEAWADRPLPAPFAITNLAVMDDGDGTHRIMTECPLGGRAEELGE